MSCSRSAAGRIEFKGGLWYSARNRLSELSRFCVNLGKLRQLVCCHIAGSFFGADGLRGIPTSCGAGRQHHEPALPIAANEQPGNVAQGAELMAVP
jgi:hypothetical protein